MVKKRKVNVVTATGVTGIYKDKYIELHIGDTGRNSSIYVDGKKLNHCVSAVITLSGQDKTKLRLEFLNQDTIY